MPPITRREALKLASAASLTSLAPIAKNVRSTPRWEIFETTFEGPSTGNPFAEVTLTATFTLGHRAVSLEGFYDGAGQYRIRFMPDAEGSWYFTTQSNIPTLNGHTGAFLCTPPTSHGPVGVADTYHFAHADGTPFFPFGTTCYAWVHQPEKLQAETLATLKKSPFNKLRMCVFPKHYEYNHNEPTLFPFAGTPGHFDLTRPNPAFYAHLEQRLAGLHALHIEADLILFHPYDDPARWGFASMPPAADDAYLRYLLARLSCYRNLWWSVANEWDLMHSKKLADFDRFFHLIEQHDPYAHLRSIHHSGPIYDNSHPWVTHASLQVITFEKALEYRNAWHKPVCFDEIQYEGNLNKRWGNVSGDELTRRFWLCLIQGCYATHGETFLPEDATLDEATTPTIWWSHGGDLHGASPAHIAFLQSLIQSPLTPSPDPYYLNATAFDTTGKNPRQILYFMDFHQPLWYEFPLPEGTYKAEALDIFAHTITPIPGTHSGKSRIRMPVKPYAALRFTRL
jgi:hypothetical protein